MDFCVLKGYKGIIIFIVLKEIEGFLFGKKEDKVCLIFFVIIIVFVDT